MDRVKVSRAEPHIKAIIRATFPNYKGRKVSVVRRDRPLDVRSYWDGGTRSYFVAIDLRDASKVRTLPVPQNGTPFDGGPIAPDGVAIPQGFAIVEEVIFCGKDLGLRIHVPSPDVPEQVTGVAALLPAGA